jgi:predicted DNA-binding transcriptional regulator
MNEDVLRKIGLTDSEIRVYLALLELGDSTRSAIVNESNIAGSKVYDVLEKLQEKGLASVYLEDKIKHFKPTNPKQILSYLEDKKQDIAKTEEQAKNIIPQLLLRFNSSKEEQEVELLTGLKGLELIFREQIELLGKGECCYVIGGTRGIDEGEIMVFFQKIHCMREQKKIRTKMLYNKIQKGAVSKNYSAKMYPCTTTRYIEHTSPVAINIYKDRTVIIVFAKKINAIHIKSQDVANSFMEYFNLLWKQGTP